MLRPAVSEDELEELPQVDGYKQVWLLRTFLWYRTSICLVRKLELVKICDVARMFYGG